MQYTLLKNAFPSTVSNSKLNTIIKDLDQQRQMKPSADIPDEELLMIRRDTTEEMSECEQMMDHLKSCNKCRKMMGLIEEFKPMNKLDTKDLIDIALVLFFGASSIYFVRKSMKD